MIQPDEASGELEAIYQQARDPNLGRPANIMLAHSLNPEAMAAHLNMYRTLMFGKSRLSRTLRELIAVVVSQANRCHY
jgi:alkylhydroperoxidase family enzyme